jgi:DNA-binding winged helix-turn-helix (wHTH) protein/Tol biopolymer transport system component
MEGKDFCCYEFDEFRLDARRRALSKNGDNVPLSARNFDLLLFMVENSGRVLEHDELLDKVWAGTFVEQATLIKGVSILRQILEEKSETEFIKTIPRRGYSFISPVRVVPEHEEILFVRETEREIIVEEFEETDDFSAPEEIIDPDSVKILPSAETKKTGFARLAIVSVAGIAALAAAFFGLKPYFSKAAQTQFSIENTRVTRVTTSGKVMSGTSISPDGTYILYPQAENDGVSLWVRQTSVNSANRITPPVNGSFYGFRIAPDNSYVYYILNHMAEPQKNGLYKIPLFGGEPQRIKEAISTFAISPDGKRIALVRLGVETRIFTVNADGEDEREVVSLPADSRLWGMSWTPDGSALLCTIRKTVETKPLYYISEISPENGKETIILPLQEKFFFGAVWTPDKSSILMTMREANADIRQIWQYFPGSQEWRRVTNDDNSYHSVDVTRDGKTIVSTQLSRLAAIWISESISMDRKKPEQKSLLKNSDNFRQITSGVSNFDQIGWVSDERLIYSATEDGKETISTITGEGENPRQITNGEDGIWIFPKVSVNGQSICFLSTRTGARQVWRVEPDGKNPTKMTDTSSPITAARILRDNSTVIYTNTFLFKQTADGQTTQLTDSDTGSFAISPDEKLLAAEMLDKTTGKFNVRLISLEDGKTIKTFDLRVLRELSFTPDGKNLAFDAQRSVSGVSQIMIQPLSGEAPFAITDFQTDEIFSFDWSPNGNRLAVIRGKQLSDAVVIKSNSR